MSKKFKVPAIFLQEIEPILFKHLTNFTYTSNEECYYYIEYSASPENMYFKILRDLPQGYKPSQPNMFAINYKPKSLVKLNSLTQALTITSIKESLVKWFELVEVYQKTQSVLDDPIIRSYQKEFEKRLSFIDEDDPSHQSEPFPINVQLALISYLNNVDELIKNSKVIPQEAASEIIDDISELKSTINNSSRYNVRKKIKIRQSLFTNRKRMGTAVLL